MSPCENNIVLIISYHLNIQRKVSKKKKKTYSEINYVHSIAFLISKSLFQTGQDGTDITQLNGK